MARLALSILLACTGAACDDGGVDAPGDSGGGSGSGLAAQYPNDENIGSDPRVIFADDFESYGTPEGAPTSTVYIEKVTIDGP